jgi:hypothetical protein
MTINKCLNIRLIRIRCLSFLPPACRQAVQARLAPRKISD